MLNAKPETHKYFIHNEWNIEKVMYMTMTIAIVGRNMYYRTCRNPEMHILYILHTCIYYTNQGQVFQGYEGSEEHNPEIWNRSL